MHTVSRCSSSSSSGRILNFNFILSILDFIHRPFAEHTHSHTHSNKQKHTHMHSQISQLLELITFTRLFTIRACKWPIL